MPFVRLKRKHFVCLFFEIVSHSVAQAWPGIHLVAQVFLEFTATPSAFRMLGL